MSHTTAFLVAAFICTLGLAMSVAGALRHDINDLQARVSVLEEAR